MNYPDILSIKSDTIISEYSEKDTILYALGVGMGADPMNRDELPFVYEKGLRALPTMSVILGTGAGKIITEGGINYRMQLHGEQRLEIHSPLPPAGRIATSTRCLSVVDKGADKGALLNMECLIADAASNELFATIVMTIFCRGDGGFGGPATGGLALHGVPSRAPDKEVAIRTRPDQAILYRLNGDLNPLHVDPDAAAEVGFDRPILHGLCSYGVACRAVLQAFCDYDPARILSFDVRFSSPVYPGETIVTRMWKDDDIVSFECSVAERPVTVIRNGRCALR